MSLSIQSFFHYYIFNPLELKNERDRWLAFVTTIALGVLSLGIVHLVCYTELYQKKITVKTEPEQDASDKKTTNVFQDTNPIDAWVDIIRHGAESGDSEFQYTLGKLYLDGAGVEKSESKATELFKKAAESGHKVAQYHLATLYEKGKGVPKSDVEAVKWYQASADQEYPYALNNLAVMYLNGAEGVAKSMEVATQLLECAVKQGDKTAARNLEILKEGS